MRGERTLEDSSDDLKYLHTHEVHWYMKFTSPFENCFPYFICHLQWYHLNITQVKKIDPLNNKNKTKSICFEIQYYSYILCSFLNIMRKWILSIEILSIFLNYNISTIKLNTLSSFNFIYIFFSHISCLRCHNWEKLRWF